MFWKTVAVLLKINPEAAAKGHYCFYTWNSFLDLIISREIVTERIRDNPKLLIYEPG